MIIGKVAGGILAAIGIPGAIFIISRTPGQTQEALTFCIVGVIGILIFIFCNLRRKRTHENNIQPTPAAKKTKESLIAWAVLLALAGVFIFITYLLV